MDDTRTDESPLAEMTASHAVLRGVHRGAMEYFVDVDSVFTAAYKRSSSSYDDAGYYTYGSPAARPLADLAGAGKLFDEGHPLTVKIRGDNPQLAILVEDRQPPITISKGHVVLEGEKAGGKLMFDFGARLAIVVFHGPIGGPMPTTVKFIVDHGPVEVLEPLRDTPLVCTNLDVIMNVLDNPQGLLLRWWRR